jgi:hypothetical protein
MNWSETTLRVVYLLLEMSGSAHTKSIVRAFNQVVSIDNRLTLGAIRHCLYKLEQDGHTYRQAGRFGVFWHLVKPVNPDLYCAACDLSEAEKVTPRQVSLPVIDWSKVPVPDVSGFNAMRIDYDLSNRDHIDTEIRTEIIWGDDDAK